MNVKSLVSLFECDESPGRGGVKAVVFPNPVIENLLIKTPPPKSAEEHNISRRIREMKADNTLIEKNIKVETNVLPESQVNEFLNPSLIRQEDKSLCDKAKVDSMEAKLKSEAKDVVGNSSGPGKMVDIPVLSTPIDQIPLKLIEFDFNIKPKKRNSAQQVSIASLIYEEAVVTLAEEKLAQEEEKDSNEHVTSIKEPPMLIQGYPTTLEPYSESLLDDYLAQFEPNKFAPKRNAADPNSAVPEVNTEVETKGTDMGRYVQFETDHLGAEAEKKDTEDDLTPERIESTSEGAALGNDDTEIYQNSAEVEGESTDRVTEVNSRFSTYPITSKDLYFTPPESPTDAFLVPSPSLAHTMKNREEDHLTELMPPFKYESLSAAPIDRANASYVLHPFSAFLVSGRSPPRPSSKPPRISLEDSHHKFIIRMEDTIDHEDEVFSGTKVNQGSPKVDRYNDRDTENCSNIFQTPVLRGRESPKSNHVSAGNHHGDLHWYKRNPFKRRKARGGKVLISRESISKPINLRDIAFEDYSRRTGTTQPHPVIELLATGPKMIDRGVQTDPLTISTAYEITRNSIQRLRQSIQENRRQATNVQKPPKSNQKDETFEEYVNSVFKL